MVPVGVRARGASAQALLANMYYFVQGVPQDYAEAARWYRFAAEQGDVEAQRLLGIMHYFGQGMRRTMLRRARWYRLAAEQGNADAQTRLGLLYYGGQGVSKDYAEAALVSSGGRAGGCGSSMASRRHLLRRRSAAGLR